MTVPPGPPLPAPAQAALYMARPFDFLDACARRYGDLFTLRFPMFGTMVCASRPETLREIFTGDPASLRVGEGNAPFRPLIGPSSILLLDGAPHVLQRKLMAPLFHEARAEENTEIIRDVAARALSRWPAGRPVPLQEEAADITLEVILRTVLGMDEGPLLSEMRGAIADLLRRNTSMFAALLLLPPLQRDLGPATPWAAFRRDMDRVDRLVYAHLARRRGEGAGDRRDVLSRMLRAADSEAAPMSDLELRDALMTLLVAGHETTGTSLCWAFARILREPTVRERLLAELQDVTRGAPLAAEHVARLPYLEATVKETLRLHPVVPIIGVGRKLAEPARLGGRQLPAGVKILPAMYLTHRRPDLYPEPDRFSPDRFLDKKVDPYAWLPFGGGVRRCLGLPFALHEMKVVIATVLLRARLAPIARPMPAATVHGITIAPVGGAAVTVERFLA